MRTSLKYLPTIAEMIIDEEKGTGECYFDYKKHTIKVTFACEIQEPEGYVDDGEYFITHEAICQVYFMQFFICESGGDDFKPLRVKKANYLYIKEIINEYLTENN